MRGFIIFSIIFFIFDGWLWWIGLTSYSRTRGYYNAVYSMFGAFLILGYIFLLAWYIDYRKRPREPKMTGRRRARTYFATILGGFFILMSGVMLHASQNPWVDPRIPQGPTMVMLANLLVIAGVPIFLGGILWLLWENLTIETPEDRYRRQRDKDLQYARSLVKARRFDDAARIYERYEMYEEAGNVRAQGEIIRVKQTKVSVDLNDLLKQAKNGGLVVVYRCPHCDGNIKISGDTNVESLKTCQYCGTTIKTVGLIEYLKSALD